MNEFLPDSCLLGVMLAVSSHSGPQVIYHYPPSNRILETARDAHMNQQLGSTGLKRETEGRSMKSRGHPGNWDMNSELDSDLHSSKMERTASSSSSSSLSSPSSGLSDSELSTDYADWSTSGSSSDSELDLQTPDDSRRSQLENAGARSTRNVSPVSMSRNTSLGREPKDNGQKISASKLLDILNDPKSQFTKINTNDTNDDQFNMEEDDDLIEFDYMTSEKRVDITEEFFTEANYQDTSKFFEFDIDFLAELCCPSREMCNTRFELTVDEYCFLGHPIHVDSSGNWRKSRKRNNSLSKSKRSGSLTGSRKRSGSKSSNHDKSFSAETPNSPESSKIIEEVGSLHKSRTLSNPQNDHFTKDMTMFHVCFIMDPNLIEYNKRVDDMYQYVVARLSVLLRYLQSKNDYVSEQCELILKEKEKVFKNSKHYKSLSLPSEKGRYLYQRLLAKSSLARALTECVEKIKKNEIACLEITDHRTVSLQIPIQNEFSILPQYKLYPVLKGSFLTSIQNNKFLEKSANIDDNHHAKSARDTNLISDHVNTFSNGQTKNEIFYSKNMENALTAQNDYDDDDLLLYSILLLDDPDKIIADLDNYSSNDDIGGVILKQLVKVIQPNVPLLSYQYIINELLAEKPLSSSTTANKSKQNKDNKTNTFYSALLRSCALHLIYWRHARAILPISFKNTYIVSPLSPVEADNSEMIKGNRKPSITDLNVTSNSSSKIPVIYLNQQSFKLKFPSLPSLPTFLNILSLGKPKAFGNIIPSKEHKPIYMAALIWLIQKGYLTQLLTFVYIRVDKKIKMKVDEDLEKEGFRTNRRRRQEDNVDNKLLSTDENANEPPKSTKVDINDNTLEGRDTEYDSDSFDYDDPEFNHDYTIILEPERATALEKRWIYKCIQDQPQDIKILFNKVMKYMNGRTAMETVMLKEHISRHDIKRLLTSLGNYIVELNHW